MLYLRSQGHLLLMKRKTCERSPLLTRSCNGTKKKDTSHHLFLLSVCSFIKSQVLVDVLRALGRSLSYSAILDFVKYAIITTSEFTDTLSEEELMECFFQLISHNFDHNENKTTGACIAHVMSLISSQYPKSNIILTANNEKNHYF